ncbi:MAG TPA: SDR family NAD(P)-dependent oxidoreductase [Stellaceae bacterium]|nr:SDR family NAD(P)-dependent oxidoreductase [Stellaceae bacterium]
MAAPSGGRLQGRLALITGASRGLGAALAKRFATEGAHVILTARTQGGLEEVDDEIRKAGGTPATLLPLDLRELDKIDQMGVAIQQRFGRLDVLVGNAAVLGKLSPLGHLDPKSWDEVMAVNLTANWRLIRSLDPLLRLSDAGRALFVTCAAARDLAAYWGAYAASKAALEALVRIYARELGVTKATANLVDPGVLGTALRLRAFPGEDRAKLPSPETRTEIFVALAEARSARNGELVSAVA